MSNYANGKIYAIRSHQTEQIYIGSTIQPLNKRMEQHKNRKNIGDCSSKIILQYEDVYIELIEFFPCNSKEELNKKEGEHIRINNCVNKLIAGRTQKEYKKENKKQINQRMKEYNQRPEVKEARLIRQKKYEQLPGKKEARKLRRIKQKIIS